MTPTHPRRRAVLAAAATAGATLGAVGAPAALAQGQAWPNKPIRWINPYAAGGTTDMIARAVAQKMSERLGQQVLVDNRPGAGGNIGTDLGAKAAPDGYTWTLGNIGPMAVNPSLYKGLSYDPVRDFTPISLLIGYANVFVVGANSPYKTMADLIRAAKAAPMAYAGQGVGTSLHLTGELLVRQAGIKLTHIPYKGGAPALQDLMAGVVPMSISTISAPMALIRAGKLRALAVTSLERSALLPDVPTVAESGVPGFEVIGWLGLVVPRGTPQPIVSRLSTEVTAVMQTPDMKTLVNDKMASFVPPLGPEHFAKFIQAENAKWRDVIVAANIKAE